MASWRAVVLALMLIFCVPETTDAKLAEDFFKARGLKLLHQNVPFLSKTQNLFSSHVTTDRQIVLNTYRKISTPNSMNQ